MRTTLNPDRPVNGRSFRNKRLLRSWTRLDLALLAAIALVLAIGLVWAATGQTPPMPDGSAPAITNTVTVAWDRNPADDYYAAVDSNGLPVPLTYRVRQSHSITNPLPWPVVVETTNTTAVISNLTARTHFWYVTVSNFFLESEPSRIVALPFDPPTNLRIKIP